MAEIAQEVIKEHEADLYWIEQEEIKFAYVYSDREKRKQGRRIFGECKKADPTTKELAQCDFIITSNILEKWIMFSIAIGDMI